FKEVNMQLLSQLKQDS
ncbi:hypothetical protein, partial [Legionella pneumophila]